jgi:hypothetical protein
MENLGVGGKIILKQFSKKCNLESWSGLIWLRIETAGGLL